MSSNTSRTLDNTARSIDLVNTLVQAAAENNSIVAGLLDIGEWLGREKLDRSDLTFCLQVARGLWAPNPAAQNVFHDITKGGFYPSISHLFLKKSGSLGHLIASDPRLQWMVSTVACLFQFESCESVVSNTLCELVILAGDFQGDGKATEELRTFGLGSHVHPLRTQIKSVLDKIVSSIWLNVVNAGLHTMDFPEELHDVCPKGHHINGIHLARIATLLRKGHGHIAVRSRHLLRNLVFWILNHFDGHLQVTVSAKKIMDRALGDGTCQIDIIVEQYCPAKGQCGAETSNMVVLADISGQLQDVFTTINTNTDTLRPVPGKRRDLYILPTPYSLRDVFSDSAIEPMIQDRAKKIASWLCRLPIGLPAPNSERLTFPVILDRQTTEKETRYDLTVTSLLGRVPGIIHLDWESSETRDKETQVFQANVSKYHHSEDSQSEGSEVSSSQRNNFGYSSLAGHIGGTAYPAWLIQHFPVIKSMLRRLSRCCLCQTCRKSLGTRETRGKHMKDENLAQLQDGCLRSEGLNRLLKFLAHSIADGLGCSTASGVSHGSAITDAMGKLLYELVGTRQIVWDTWFHVAATVALGCPSRPSVGLHHTRGSAVAAIQYGSLSLVAKWLDISQKIHIRHCFSALEQQGRLGVMQNNGDGSPQFREVQDGFAVLQTERTQDNTSLVARHMDEEEPSGRDELRGEIGADASPVESRLFLIQISDSVWGILLKVESSEHSRFINPADAILGLACTVRDARCDHRDQRKLKSWTLPESETTQILVHSFDELLGLWVARGRIGGSSDRSVAGDSGNESCDDDGEVGDGNEHCGTPQRPGGRIHLSMLLDDALKVNTALALSVSQRVLLRDVNKMQSCLDCNLRSGLTCVITDNTAEDLSVVKFLS